MAKNYNNVGTNKDFHYDTTEEKCELSDQTSTSKTIKNCMFFGSQNEILVLKTNLLYNDQLVYF